MGPAGTGAGVRVTHWKEGGLESPMPPVRSMDGGSSVWLSAQTDPASEWDPSADTSWGDETKDERAEGGRKHLQERPEKLAESPSGPGSRL